MAQQIYAELYKRHDISEKCRCAAVSRSALRSAYLMKASQVDVAGPKCQTITFIMSTSCRKQQMTFESVDSLYEWINRLYLCTCERSFLQNVFGLLPGEMVISLSVAPLFRVSVDIYLCIVGSLLWLFCYLNIYQHLHFAFTLPVMVAVSEKQNPSKN